MILYRVKTMNTIELKEEEDKLRSRVTALPPDQRKWYYILEEKQIKDPDTYAVLNYFFLGGLHHLYLRKYILGSLYLITTLFGMYRLLIGIVDGWLLLLLIFLIELPQLFRSQQIVLNYNNNVMKRILKQISDH